MKKAKDPGVLHANRTEAVDVKESSVVDLLSGDAPGRETINLAAKQRVQHVETLFPPPLSVEPPDVLIDEAFDVDVAVVQVAKAILCPLFKIVAVCYVAGFGLGVSWN